LEPKQEFSFRQNVEEPKKGQNITALLTEIDYTFTRQ